MNQPSITVVIDGNTYTLQVSDLQGIRDMPADDRSQLIRLLEVVKAQHEKSQRLVQEALLKTASAATAGDTAVAAEQAAPAKERMGKGDIDQLMARLIAEERQQQKPAIQKSTIYKIVAVLVGIIVVLSMI